MGVIRTIAEEELVVAILEWIKQKTDQFTKHRGRFVFYPVLRQLWFILANMMEGFVTKVIKNI